MESVFALHVTFNRPSSASCLVLHVPDAEDQASTTATTAEGRGIQKRSPKRVVNGCLLNVRFVQAQGDSPAPTATVLEVLALQAK